MSNTKTIGEKRVRTEFNPSSNGAVDTIKQDSARLINQINELQVPEGKDASEFHRLKALAMTSAEEAAMWAVKAATY